MNVFIISCFVLVLVYAGMLWITRRESAGFRLLAALPTSVLMAWLAWGVLLLNPELHDARFRVYKKFYNDLHVGMTQQEVFAILDKHYPISGPRLRPKILGEGENVGGFLMHPEHLTEPNCEGVFLSWHEGRVAKVQYSPD